jgi:NADPH-dependent 2,4-dienoyl-CoA reductase/sulfur reductase-like enzyme
MPILNEPEEKIHVVLPPRKALHSGRTNVLVVGGGPAGIGAAAGAAKAGAGTILVERHGFLGGNATAALVMPLMSFHTQKYQAVKKSDSPAFFPSDHGTGDPVIAGVLSEFLGKLVKKWRRYESFPANRLCSSI